MYVLGSEYGTVRLMKRFKPLKLFHSYFFLIYTFFVMDIFSFIISLRRENRKREGRESERDRDPPCSEGLGVNGRLTVGGLPLVLSLSPALSTDE